MIKTSAKKISLLMVIGSIVILAWIVVVNNVNNENVVTWVLSMLSFISWTIVSSLFDKPTPDPEIVDGDLSSKQKK